MLTILSSRELVGASEAALGPTIGEADVMLKQGGLT